MALERYRRKRNFKKTSEPRPVRRSAKKSGEHLSYVIQKHAARRLHYDFRLELEGTLKSWAIPKGPSLDPTMKRLAVHVEDHPLEYGSFEGRIPKGQYGGGTVQLWDRGTWIPKGNPLAGYRQGKLEFTLAGRKLRGAWVLLKMKGRERQNEDNWLLKKIDDKEARSEQKGSILDRRPESVASGRTIEEIASKKPRSSSKKEAVNRPVMQALKNVTKHKNTPSRSASPPKVRPQLATLVDSIPVGDEWLHEIKFDGFRTLAYKDKRTVTLFSRNDIERNARFSGIHKELQHLAAQSALLDGEIVVLDEQGKSDFHSMHEALHDDEQSRFVYMVFDLLYLNGVDVRELPLIERKEVLKKLLEHSRLKNIRYTEHIEGIGESVWLEVQRLGLEGVVSKLKDSPYSSGRSRSWLKIRHEKGQEFVIGGYTDSTSPVFKFGSLLLGYYNDAHLVYAGKVGTGFSDKLRQELYRKFRPLAQAKSPFTKVPRAARRGAHWIAPKLVAEIAFTEWTSDGRLRHPSFEGLRDDKDASQVHKESPSNEKRPKKSTPTVTVEGVALSNADREIYPGAGISKEQLARYYSEISSWRLPHLQNRPLVLVRCPEGGSECFFQKHADAGFPKAIKRITIKEKTSKKAYLSITSIKDVISLVQLNALEFHLWGATIADIEKPDRMIFDLDPDPELPWPDVVATAKSLRVHLQKLGLVSFVKTTGGRGLHVAIPLVPKLGWDDFKALSREIASVFCDESPVPCTLNSSKAKRKGKVFIDYMRNGRGATSIAPYSVRARPGALVSMPLAWENLSPQKKEFSTKDILKRFHSQKDDPWKAILKTRQKIG